MNKMTSKNKIAVNQHVDGSDEDIISYIKIGDDFSLMSALSNASAGDKLSKDDFHILLKAIEHKDSIRLLATLDKVGLLTSNIVLVNVMAISNVINVISLLSTFNKMRVGELRPMFNKNTFEKSMPNAVAHEFNMQCLTEIGEVARFLISHFRKKELRPDTIIDLSRGYSKESTALISDYLLNKTANQELGNPSSDEVPSNKRQRI